MDDVTVLALGFIVMSVLALMSAYSARDYKFKLLEMRYKIRLLELELAEYRNKGKSDG